MRNSSIKTQFLAVVHQHADSVLALRIVVSICLAIVFFAGLYICVSANASSIATRK